MEGKKENRGGDRRSGTAVKTKTLFGFRYTEEEYNEMTTVLKKFKAETGKTT